MNGASDIILQVENLTVTFNDTEIIHDLSFVLPHRQTLGIVGESGSGKSVCAMSLLQLISSPPLSSMSGRVMYNGANLLELTNGDIQAIRGSDIAFIFQEPMTALNPVFTIGEQIIETIRRHRPISKAGAMEMALQLLREVGISAPELRLRNFPHQLSGGMRQRAMIAMALSCGPKILIADEPTTALDVTVQAQILELFKKLMVERQMSIIFITHDLGVVAEIADLVMVMRHGRCVEAGGVVDIFNNPQHEYTKSLIDLLPVLQVKNG